MKKLLIVLVAIGLLSGSALAADPRCAAGMARGVTKYCGGAGDKVTSDARLGLNKALAFVVIGENAMKAGEYSKASFNFISALNLGLDTYTRDRLLQGFVALSNYYYSQ